MVQEDVVLADGAKQVVLVALAVTLVRNGVARFPG